MEDIEVRSAEAFGKIMSVAHEAAKLELIQAEDAIRRWIEDVFGGILTKETELDVIPNRWHEILQIGLESYSIKMGRKGREIFVPRQHKAPTVGVTSKDLIPEAESLIKVVEFVPDQIERLKGLSKPGPLISTEPTRPFLDNPRLARGKVGSVENPKAVRVALRMLVTKANKGIITPDQIPPELIAALNGVYGCEFLSNLK